MLLSSPRPVATPDKAHQAVGPDPNLKRILLHVDPLDEELDDPRLLGGEQLVPNPPRLDEERGGTPPATRQLRRRLQTTAGTSSQKKLPMMSIGAES
jgi:hypothetical protein